jgi:flagellar hook-basal body complex protein FliE
MDIASISAQLRALSAKAAGVTPVTQAVETQSNFSNTLKNAIENVNQLENDATSFKKSFELGDSSIGLHDVMVASQKAKIAFSALTEVRNKFVSAYQEIMNMQT